MSINTCNTPISVWLAEGQSSQRDMLLSLQALKAQQMPLHIIASHRHDRPEILGCADMAYREPHFLPQGLPVFAKGRGALSARHMCSRWHKNAC